MERKVTPPENGTCYCNNLPIFVHELAQSLSIISSYIKGCSERVKKDSLDLEQVIKVFEKVNQQIQIMGDKIHCMI